MSAVAVKADPRALGSLITTYCTIAEWLLYPEEIDPDTLTDTAVDAAVAAARGVDPAVGEHLRAFHENREIDLEEYLNLLELNPRCPLYLGSYQFAEPSTCAAAGVSDRNQYMIEIGNIYKHFGFDIQTELPDFLPAVTEFLAMTADSEGENAALRDRFIERMIWPGVRLFADKLAAEDTQYLHLAEAILICLEHELGRVPEMPEREPTAGVPQSELIQIELGDKE